MPKYYFHIRSSDNLIEDKEGVELGDIGCARDEAEASAREIMAGKIRRGEVIDGDAFEVHDRQGQRVMTVPFKSVLRLS